MPPGGRIGRRHLTRSLARFRCVEDPNLVAIDLVGVKSDVLGPVLADPNFQKLEKAIGEKEKAMFVVMSG